MSQGEENYWDNFYSFIEKTDNKMPPSQFAAFCRLELVHLNINQLIEIAAGEGRDSIFFASQGIQTIALDKSSEAVNFLKKRISHNKNVLILKIDAVNEDLPTPKFKDQACAYYARFFLHTLEENHLIKFFEKLSSSMKKNDVFFTEYRDDNDENLEKTMPDHFRKFYTSHFVNKLANQNRMKCIYEISGKGFAKWGIEDAFVTRQVFIKE